MSGSGLSRSARLDIGRSRILKKKGFLNLTVLCWEKFFGILAVKL